MIFPSDRKSTTLYILALAFALAFIVFDSSWRLTQVNRATAFALASTAASGPLSTPGVHERNTILPAASMDARWWVILTEQMNAEGDLRVRYTHQDNAPAGREVHWSSLPMWILTGIGSVIGLLGETDGTIPQAALYFGPTTLIAALVGLSVIVFRAYGGITAAVFCLSMVGGMPLFLFFRAGEADHHGLVSICSLASVLFLVIGGLGLSPKTKTSKKKKAEVAATGEPGRGWFIASGVAGAAGIWISAASQIPVLAGCGLAILVVVWWAARSGEFAIDPGVWRVWGISGGMACIGFYLLEYFPSHLGLRMEVNNPLYAAAWIGAGFLLESIVRYLSGEKHPRMGWPQRGLLAVAVVAISAPAVVIAGAKDKLFWVSDRFVFDLHRFYIREFQNLTEFLKGDAAFAFALNFLLLPTLCVIVAVALLMSGRISMRRRYELAFTLGPALIVQILALSQVRWMGNAVALWIVTLIIMAVAIQESVVLRKGWKIGATALFLVVMSTHPVQSVLAALGTNHNAGTVDREFLPSMLTRDIALRINRSYAGQQPHILSGPTSSTEFAYYGGDSVLGTLYWENRPGLEAAADIYAATDEAEFKELLQKRGITHLVLFSWDSFAQSYVRLHRGLGRTDEARDGCLAGYLEGKRPQPVWLRPLYYPIPESYKLKDAWVRIYQVVPDQTLSQWHYHVGMYQLDAGRAELAEKSFREAIKLDPNYAEAKAALESVTRQEGR